MSTATTIQQYYNAFYGRPADPSGLAFWVNGVNGTGDLIGSAIRAFGSPSTPEFALRFPAGTPISTFLDTAYGNMFNRVPDADGKSFWSAAFTNWVGTGKSEGEARALILQNFVDAANGQSGTNDKLTITNKLTVADAMTASVKAYGTESVYMTQLNKAQGLLAGVDYTQASVDAALGRIKLGAIDEIDSGPGAPVLPVYVIDNPQGVMDSGHEIQLSNARKDIIKIDAAADSPFAAKLDGRVYLKAGVSLTSFSVGTDKIDVSALHLIFSGSASTTKETGFTIENFFPSLTVQTVFQQPHIGFFAEKPIIISGWQSPSAGQSSYVFIDVNNDRNLDGNDIMIMMPGVAPASATDILFIL